MFVWDSAKYFQQYFVPHTVEQLRKQTYMHKSYKTLYKKQHQNRNSSVLRNTLSKVYKYFNMCTY